VGALGPAAFDLQSDARRVVALALLGKDDASGAEPVLREALALDRVHYGERHAATIDDEIQLGNALTEQSRFAESIALLRTAADQARSLHGPVHSQLAGALGELSGALSYSGDYAGSEAASREAADIDEKIYGAEHNETLVARGNQFWSVERAGRYAEALQERLAFAPLLEKITTTRPETAAAWYTSIAQDHARLGHYDEAEAAFRKALAIWKTLQGSNDEWDSADPMVGLADALRWSGRYDEAIPMLRHAIAIEQKHEPADSGWLNRDRGTLGDMLRQQGLYDDALRELGDAAQARRDAKPDPLLASLFAQLAQAQLDAGVTDAAYGSAKRSVDIARNLYPQNQWGLGYPLFSLARVELARGHAEVAEGLMREALASRSTLLRSDTHVLEIEATRVAALVALGRSTEANRLREEIEPTLTASASPYAAILRQRIESVPHPAVSTH
jgi:serine/threonine-protein kinase